MFNAPSRPASFALGISAAGGPLPSAPPVPWRPSGLSAEM